jgi:hypothetical protein
MGVEMKFRKFGSKIAAGKRAQIMASRTPGGSGGFADYSPSPAVRAGVRVGNPRVLNKIPTRGSAATRVNRMVTRGSKRRMNAALRKVY